MNKNYPIIDVPASGRSEWSEGAYTLAFVYSKYAGNFVVRGYYGEVRAYVEKHYTHYFVHYTLWSHGRSRTILDFWKDNVGIFRPSKSRKDWKYEVRPYTGGHRDISLEESNAKTFKFKRLPKRWIPEFDKF
jgi:hypothetical protein